MIVTGIYEQGLHGKQIMQILTASPAPSMTCKFSGFQVPRSQFPVVPDYLFRFQDTLIYIGTTIYTY